MTSGRTGAVEVFGYGSCTRCGQLAKREVLDHLAGHCTKCYGEHRDEVVLSVDTATVVFQPKRKRRTRADRGHKSSQVRKATHAAEHARRRAMSRFCADFAPLYMTYLAEERLAAGLNPWTPLMLAAYDDPSMTLAELATYHARIPRGERHGTASTSTATDPE